MPICIGPKCLLFNNTSTDDQRLDAANLHNCKKNDHVCFYTVAASDWESTGVNPIGREISEIVWCDPHNPPNDVTPGTLRRLSEMVNGRECDAYW